MCLINHTFRFVFVHIPKNGGTSVALALSSLSTYRDQEIGATALGEAIAPHFRQRFGVGKHATLQEIAGLLGPIELASYHTFAVSRHPVDRAASTFSFLQRWTRWRSLPPWSEFADDFSRCEDLDAFIQSPFFSTQGPDRLFMPQTDWIIDEHASAVAVDSVLRLEHLGRDLDHVLTLLGVPPDRRTMISVPQANRSRAQGRRIEITASSMNVLADRYSRDFELLGYSHEAATE